MAYSKVLDGPICCVTPTHRKPTHLSATRLIYQMGSPSQPPFVHLVEESLLVLTAPATVLATALATAQPLQCVADLLTSGEHEAVCVAC